PELHHSTQGQRFPFGPRRRHGGACGNSDRQGLWRTAERKQKSAAKRNPSVPCLGAADGHVRSFRYKVHDSGESSDAVYGGGAVYIGSADLLLLFQRVSDEEAAGGRPSGLFWLLERAGFVPRARIVGRGNLGPRYSV